ncbi:sigma-70 family RNA polymerase sigma factor [Teredinibacter purpureus]|uniref:sigma-70 family RNA polymerase sigma factor n=1 Tax=Teredinibacter purpureus TaxID=2731756 RepID=UPI0005F82B55|nr:sigma-70 family RNA polymerase sigma factor [Teredinibacter purpureus]
MLLAQEPMVTSNTPSADCGDTELVAQAIKELPYVTRSYELLIKRYYPLIYRTCFGILRDSGEAEEASQVILLKVFNGLPRFQERSAFKTWLTKIIHNTCFSRHQKLKRDRAFYSAFTEQSDDNHNDQQDESPESLWRDSFDVMVDCLSEEEQHILSLRFVSELSLAEIATLMELGLSATKMRFYRALEKLKEQL